MWHLVDLENIMLCISFFKINKQNFSKSIKRCCSNRSQTSNSEIHSKLYSQNQSKATLNY